MTGSLATGTIPFAYAYAARYAGGRLNLPVPASQVIYASFEHVAGVAAPSGGAALSVDRLKMLDTLIGALEKIKREPLAAREAPGDLSSERVDALIQQYSAELHSAAAAPPLPYAVPAARPGLLFNVAA